MSMYNLIVLQAFGLLSGLISILCYLPYIRDILLKRTKPERASWLIWAVLGSISFISQLAKGASDSLWMTAVQTFGVTLIFLMSLKLGSGGISSRDIKALIFALFGLVIWFLTKEAAWALFIVIFVDASGALLTILKAYEDPESETMSTWMLAGLSGLFACFAVGIWDLVLLSYPVYIMLINWAVTISMLLGIKKLSKHK